MKVSQVGVTPLGSLTPSYTHFKYIPRTAMLFICLYAEANCSGQM